MLNGFSAVRLVGAIIALCLGLQVAVAADRGTPDEAKAMAERAAGYLKSNGPDQSFAAFNDPAGGFRDRDLYVYVLRQDNTLVAHPNENLVGRPLPNMRDVTGKLLNSEIMAVGTEGWIEYRWQHPQTKAVEPKVAYVVKVGEHWVVVGAYKD